MYLYVVVSIVVVSIQEAYTTKGGISITLHYV